MRMKLLTVSVISLLFSLYSSAQVRWDGGGDGISWNDALNWQGDILPVPSDDVVLDNSILGGRYEVNLPTGMITIFLNSLTITPDPGDSIFLRIPGLNTASPGLSITGPGDALILDRRSVLIDSTGTAAGGVGLSITNTFRINNGGLYIHKNIRANASIVSQLSTAAGTELGIFEYDVPSTAVYDIAGSGQNYGTLVLSSITSGGNASYRLAAGTAPMTINGNFQIDVNTSFNNASASDIIVFGNLVTQASSVMNLSSGTTSPTLELRGNVANGGTITESGTGNPVIELNGTVNQNMTVTGTITGNDLDFVINKTGTVNLLSNVHLPDDFFLQSGTLNLSATGVSNTLGVKGDLQVAGLITETGTGFPSIELDGTASQNITVTGAITGNNLDFKLNNPAGATLLANLILPYYYSIVSGNITLGNFSMTTTYVNQSAMAPVSSNHIITNGTGFLIIENVGAGQALFPVGVNASSVNTVEISNGGGLTYYVRVVEGINPSISNPLLAVNRTWIINTSPVSAPATPANITFSYYNGDGQSGFNYSSLIDVGQHTLGAWSIIRFNQNPVLNSGEFRISTFISSFNTPFILGNHGAILPIDFFIACKALKNNETGVITWKIENSESAVSFEVEKSVDNSPFKSIASVPSESKKLEYSFDDKTLDAGSNLYRIKTILLDGKMKYSNTVAVIHNAKKVLITSVSPNPVQGMTTVTISSPSRTAMRFTLYDMQGKVVKQWQQAMAEGTNTIPLQMDSFRTGIYMMAGTDGNIKTNTIRIVKQ